MSSCTSARAVEQFLRASEGACFPTDAELKHILGNLTLGAGSLNPALSRSPWEVKKAELLRCSQPGLSSELYALEDWAERGILARGRCWRRWLVGCGGSGSGSGSVVSSSFSALPANVANQLAG